MGQVLSGAGPMTMNETLVAPAREGFRKLSDDGARCRTLVRSVILLSFILAKKNVSQLINRAKLNHFAQ